jgi:hypothetical protein
MPPGENICTKLFLVGKTPCLASEEKENSNSRLVSRMASGTAKPTQAIAFGVEAQGHRIVVAGRGLFYDRCCQVGELAHFEACEKGGS